MSNNREALRQRNRMINALKCYYGTNYQPGFVSPETQTKYFLNEEYIPFDENAEDYNDAVQQYSNLLSDRSPYGQDCGNKTLSEPVQQICIKDDINPWGRTYQKGFDMLSDVMPDIPDFSLEEAQNEVKRVIRENEKLEDKPYLNPYNKRNKNICYGHKMTNFDQFSKIPWQTPSLSDENEMVNATPQQVRQGYDDLEKSYKPNHKVDYYKKRPI